MIILGDIAAPTRKTANDLDAAFQQNGDIFQGRVLVANLEGLVHSNENALRANTPVLFNHPNTIQILGKWNIAAVGLANNHTLDLPEQFQETVSSLSRHKIAFTGAGLSKLQAAAPARIVEQEKEVWIFNYCWNFLFYHQSNPSNGVFLSDMNENKIIHAIRQHREKYPTASIIVFLHWSFDLETLPFPMNRQFAQYLIDEGVNVVAGCHSHCVQGGEKYKDGYIVYGLGNFFLPQKIFANGRLSFPTWANPQLAFEWNPVTNEANCHWFEYEFDGKDHRLKFITSEAFETSERLKNYSPYQGLSQERYLPLYLAKRRKKTLVPVFKDFRSVSTNYLKLSMLKSRAHVARMMARLGLIPWQH